MGVTHPTSSHCKYAYFIFTFSKATDQIHWLYSSVKNKHGYFFYSFPHEDFGKLYGLSLAVSALVSSLQFPLQLPLVNRNFAIIPSVVSLMYC